MQDELLNEVRRIVAVRPHPFETKLQAEEIKTLKESLKNLSSEEARYVAATSHWSWIRQACKSKDVEARYERWRSRAQAYTGRYCTVTKPANDTFVSFWVSKVGGVAAICKILNVSHPAVSRWVAIGRFPPAQALVLGVFFRCPHHAFDHDTFKHEIGAPTMSELRAYFGYEGSRSFERRKRIVKSKAV
jgi:uncharacterized protein (DUF849 family)